MTWKRDAASRARAKTYNSRRHRETRAAIQHRIDRGETVTCWRCGTRLHGRAWHLGHDDWDRTVYRGAECATCNIRAAARKGGIVAKARRNGQRHTPTAPQRRHLLG